jgi:hypothetical protein
MNAGILDLQSPDKDGITAQPASAPRRPYGLFALAAAVIALGSYSVWGVQSSRSSLGNQQTVIGQLSGKLAALKQENLHLGSQLAETRSQLEDSTKRLMAADELQSSRARTFATQGRAEAQRSAKQFEDKLGEQQKEVGALAGAVGGIQGDVAVNRAEIDTAVKELLRHGNLIATNHDELVALKRMGFRDYFEFDLRQSKTFTRVGPVALRLNKTDRGHGRYTLTVVVDDKRVEKKDNGLLEPVQFYVPGTRSMLEVVAAEIHDGRVVGYVSAPKETTPIS